jgi:nicotinamidase-related amidase
VPAARPVIDQPENETNIPCQAAAGLRVPEHPEVATRSNDVLIHKSLPGSFTGTELETWLRDRGAETVVIAGYMTQMCCDTTARQAMHLGFGVEFLSDGTGTLAIKNDAGEVSDEELHRAILVTQQMRFSRVMKTGDWIKQL